jgi:DNA-binding TFAR19-related protein (PDSD5 family)
MDTDEIQAVRDARAQQLQQTAGIAGSDGQANDAAQRREAEAEETRRDVLATLLEPTARERCECVLTSLILVRFTIELTRQLRRFVTQYLG